MHKRKSRATDGRCRGFTLFEAVVMIGLISIMTAAALPRWSASLQKHRLGQAANRIVADIVRARTAAYGTSTSKTITFAVASSQYTVSGVAPLHRASGTYTVNLTETPYQCTLASVWGQAGTQTITFDGHGLPDKGGSIVVAAGSLQTTIVVDATTGLAVIQ